VRDSDCVEFLQWALPGVRKRWAGYRKVRRQVCRRVELRIRELGLAGVDAYRDYLESTPEEWPRLDGLCQVTISRFRRDRGVFEFLERSVLPELATEARARGRPLAAWSAGCASGEEPYTLVLGWEYLLRSSFPTMEFGVLATDADRTMLTRARAAAYGEASLRELPPRWRREAFVRRGGRCHLRPRFRQLVTFMEHDVRGPAPDGPFDLVLCRNLAFTYFDLSLQREVAEQLALVARPGGALVIGSHETLPENSAAFAPWRANLGVYRRST
jgi:chemotaxis protein methyltransferase CheR